MSLNDLTSARGEIPAIVAAIDVLEVCGQYPGL
jgi:hypothetical protein